MGSHIYSQFHNPKYLILFALGGLLFFTPSVSKAQTCTGNVIGVTSVYGVSSPSSCIGVVNNSAAQVKSTGEFITLDFGVTLASGATYIPTWARNTTTTQVVITVEESTDGATFTAATGSPFTVTSTSYVTQNIVASRNTRYLRLTWVSGARLLLDAITYTNQMCINATTSLTCSATATQISGYVFRDMNHNGSYESNADFLGVNGMTVTAYNAAGTAFTATTDSTGKYTIIGLTASTPYRVELTLATGFPISTPFGTHNGTSVQFLNSGSCANFGLASPDDYCQSDPSVVTPCYLNGDPLGGGTAGTDGVFVSLPYSKIDTVFDLAVGEQTHSALATGSQIGATWGVAYQRSTNTIFTSAFTKRHMGFGPMGTGGIYTINPTSGVVTQWLDVNTLAGVSTGADPHTGLPASVSTPNNDPNAVDAVGKISLGDIDISEDGKTLYVVNLNDRTLLVIDIATKTLIKSVAIPPSVCTTSDDRRPFGLAVRDGNVYVGGVCSGQTSGLLSDVSGWVLRLNGSSFVTEFTFPITAIRTTDCTGGGCDWQAWTNSFTNTGISGTRLFLPQPMLSDMVIDANGTFTIALMDRWGHIAGWNNYGPTGTTAVYGTVSSDIVKVHKKSDGTYHY